MTKGQCAKAEHWVFANSGTLCLSKCVIVCKNPNNKHGKYIIEFSFIGAGKHIMYFDDKKSRDDNYKFIVRTMARGYSPVLINCIHFIVHAICVLIIYTIIIMA